jgi:hypothetical protein
MSYVTIHPSKAQHDTECPRMHDDCDNRGGACPACREGLKTTTPVLTHFRVTRPEQYEPPHGAMTCPGHNNPPGRQGYFTNACCATNAARIIARRLAADVTTEADKERLDVEVWR